MNSAACGIRRTAPRVDELKQGQVGRLLVNYGLIDLPLVEVGDY